MSKSKKETDASSNTGVFSEINESQDKKRSESSNGDSEQRSSDKANSVLAKLNDESDNRSES